MTLSELQKRFMASLLLDMADPVLFADLSPLSPLSSVSSMSPSSLSSFSLLSSHQRFEIYRRNWREGMFKTLKIIYPVLCRLIGEACFRAVSLLFIQNSVSRHYSLNSFGQDFPAFIKPYATTWSLPYLTDMARLEWDIHTSLLGPVNACFSFEKLSAIAESEQEKIIFTLAENGILFFSPFAVDKIWMAHQTPRVESLQFETIELETKELETIELETIETAIETRIFIFRQDEVGYNLKLAVLTPIEWQLLSAIAVGQTLGDLYQKYAKTASQEIILTLASCVEKGYITGIVVPDLCNMQ